MEESLVFFGSGPVAADSLRFLAEKFTIEAVITKPKPVHHRGDFPMVELAKELGLRTELVSNKTELIDLFRGHPFQSRVGVLVDYGIIVPQSVIDYFSLGIVNSHFSVLPEWRGADPITFAVLSGQKQTGVSIMLLVEALDEGPLLAYGEYDLPPTITTPDLTTHLVSFSNEMLAEILPRYVLNKGFKPVPQSVTGRTVSYSRKLTKKDGIIDWAKPAEQIEREVRAFIEWPKSRATLAGKDVVITKAHVIDESGEAGQSIVRNKELVVLCGKGALSIDSLKPAGKKEMNAEAFIHGYWKSST